MLNITKERLEQLFAASRARQQRLKEKEQLKYKKAQESTKKALAKQQSKEQEKCAQRQNEPVQIEFSRNFTIYNNKFIERFMDDEDVYKTREELEEAEQRGEGRVNWERFDKLVEQTKQMLNNGKKVRN